ncbi:DUF1127 domain-containing protein [Xanthobacter sediminis]
MSLMTTFAPNAVTVQSRTRGARGTVRRVLSALHNSLSRSLDQFAAHWHNRRIMAEMARMSPAELRDMGLTEADIEYARGLPFGADSTAALARRAEERRNAVLEERQAVVARRLRRRSGRN